MRFDRRQIGKLAVGATTTLASGALLSHSAAAARYRGLIVILVRFGGGVRRRETVDQAHTYAPYFRNVLSKRGVLIPNVTIDELKDVDTSHAEGTLNLLTGRYQAYSKVGSRGLAPLLEPSEPSLFEYLRKTFDIPAHQALLVNGEDRPQEEYLTYGGHKHYGVAYRSEVIGLFRYKLHKFKRMLESGALDEKQRQKITTDFEKLKSFDYRGSASRPSRVMDRFWDDWRRQYGDSGLKNPRGDRLLTELAVRAIRQLRPRLMMINYQDPDYVHWGNASHYTRAIAIIDQGLQRLVETVDSDPEYRNDTVFVIVPACGRDANPFMSVPYQRHFNSRSAHEIFAHVFGAGVVRNRILDKPVEQTSLASTIGALMGFRMKAAEGRVLSEIIT